MRIPYFKIFQDRAGEWRWTLYGGNGEAVATSEGYTTKYSAERSAARVKDIAAIAVIY